MRREYNVLQLHFSVMYSFRSKEKKSQWYSRNKIKKSDDDSSSLISQLSLEAKKNVGECRWSDVAQAKFKRNKKQHFCAGSFKSNGEHAETIDKPTDVYISKKILATDRKSEAEYVRISKIEYEDIKIGYVL